MTRPRIDAWACTFFRREGRCAPMRKTPEYSHHKTRDPRNPPTPPVQDHKASKKKDA